ncbi:hypothetical protein NC651_033792 [Populus alba x Populus x berolinensis]|nr:hypothetical protein NC651_033792 [Populus alba x Populus x berolinensis]
MSRPQNGLPKLNHIQSRWCLLPSGRTLSLSVACSPGRTAVLCPTKTCHRDVSPGVGPNAAEESDEEEEEEEDLIPGVTQATFRLVIHLQVLPFHALL